MSQNKPKFFMGRHIDMCNYKDDQEIESTIASFLETDININDKIEINPTSFQMFIGDKTSYADKDITSYLSNKTIENIRKLTKNIKFIIHSNYLFKISKPIKSNMLGLNSVVKELKSAALLGASCVIVHTGTLRDKKRIMDLSEAKENIVESFIYIINKFLKENKTKSFPKLLIETPACQKSEVPLSFKDFGKLFKTIELRIETELSIDKIDNAKSMLGICIDTCHIFSAGYDIRSKGSAIKLIKNINKSFDLSKYLGAIHLNDAAFPLKSKRDVHASIGCGFISSEKLDGSLDGLRVLIKFAIKNKVPVVLETPSKICADINRRPSVLQKRNEKEMYILHVLGEYNEKKSNKETPNSVLYNLIDYC